MVINKDVILAEVWHEHNKNIDNKNELNKHYYASNT